jgi:hypothetical protein
MYCHSPMGYGAEVNIIIIFVGYFYISTLFLKYVSDILHLLTKITVFSFVSQPETK